MWLEVQYYVRFQRFLKKRYGPEADVWKGVLGVIVYILIKWECLPFLGRGERGRGYLNRYCMVGILTISLRSLGLSISEELRILVEEVNACSTTQRRHALTAHEGSVSFGRGLYPKEEIVGLKEMFKMIDTDGSWSLSLLKELKAGLKRYWRLILRNLKFMISMHALSRTLTRIGKWATFTPDELQKACEEFGWEDCSLGRK
ncbi:hypothetical protein NC652_026871 [Populus alba x Populus x berolinensis]|nr:hypothetical protein NC652_026871 [Populus alba x Populus x berolinensis]